jgi:ParB/RepB/Spo0J family partition protein
MEFAGSRLSADGQQAPPAVPSAVSPMGDARPVQLAKVIGDDGDRLARIPIDLIDEPPQPRQKQDAELLSRMSASIDQEGLLSPITVSRSKSPGRFNLEEGGQRLKATKLAGKTEILARVIEPVDEARRWLRHLQSNHLRASLLPGEEALGLAWLRDSLGLNNTQLAQKTKMTLSHISRRLSLLKFGLERLRHVDEGRVSDTVAVEIAKVANERDRDALFDRAVAEGNWTKERAITAVSAVTKRRKARQEGGKRIRRLTFKLGERGGSITIEAPENVAELDAETALFAVEFARQVFKKAVKEDVPASKLASFLQERQTKAKRATNVPSRNDVGSSGSSGPPPSAN